MTASSACTGSGSGEPDAASSPESMPYEEVLSRIPLNGTRDQPLYWDVPVFADPDSAEAARAARHFEALEHMLIYGPVPRRNEDLDLLLQLATEEYAAPIYRHHRGVEGATSDPWLGPRWIRVLDVYVDDDEATVAMCFDEGFYGPQSRGAGRKMWRDHRWVLTKYDLVRDPANGDEGRWKVDRVGIYGHDYPEPHPGYDARCEEWATHTLEDR